MSWCCKDVLTVCMCWHHIWHASVHHLKLGVCVIGSRGRRSDSDEDRYRALLGRYYMLRLLLFSSPLHIPLLLLKRGTDVPWPACLTGAAAVPAESAAAQAPAAKAAPAAAAAAVPVTGGWVTPLWLLF